MDHVSLKIHDLPIFKCGLFLWKTSFSLADDNEIFLTLWNWGLIIEYSDKWYFVFDVDEYKEMLGNNLETLLPKFKTHFELIILEETIVDILVLQILTEITIITDFVKCRISMNFVVYNLEIEAHWIVQVNYFHVIYSMSLLLAISL